MPYTEYSSSATNTTNGGTVTFATTSGDSTWLTADLSPATSASSPPFSTMATTSTNEVTYTFNQYIESIWGLDMYGRPKPIAYIALEPETEEERQARLGAAREREERLRARREAAEREREAAEARAEELLRDNLDEEQLAQLEKTDWFFVIGESGRRYRIRRGWSGNIDELNEEDMIVATHCIHPAVDVPTPDSMLAQKFMLEVNEKRFEKITNRRVLSTPRPLVV